MVNFHHSKGFWEIIFVWLLSHFIETYHTEGCLLILHWLKLAPSQLTISSPLFWEILLLHIRFKFAAFVQFERVVDSVWLSFCIFLSDMQKFGLFPETDCFCTVVCSECNALVKPQGLLSHMRKRHYLSCVLNLTWLFFCTHFDCLKIFISHRCTAQRASTW